jgi:hypothetical protein
LYCDESYSYPRVSPYACGLCMDERYDY